MNGFTVRPAVVSDAEAVRQLRKKVDKEPSNQNPPLDPYGGDYPTVDQQTSDIRSMTRKGIFLVAVSGEDIIGIAYSFRMYGRPHEYRLNFIVDSPWRGKGVGTAMIAQVVEWGKAHPKVHRLVSGFETTHKDARRVLEKFGFEVYKVGYAYYMQGYRYDETEMILSFPGKPIDVPRFGLLSELIEYFR